MAAGIFRDLTGLKFNRLTVVRRSDKRVNVHWVCLCDCGEETVVCTSRLTSGYTKSCGCLKMELQTKHGCSSPGKRTGEYRSWYAMIQRCTNQNHKHYKSYGMRGITVCEEWRDFRTFLNDMKEKPTPIHTVDRIDVNGNYEPSNCKWSDLVEQSRNKRVINKNGAPGIYWDDDRNNYRTFIGVFGKNQFVGRYDTVEEAIIARKAAEIKYWGKESS